MVCCLVPFASLSILFIGNSHTQANDLPNLVKSLLMSDGVPRSVTTKSMSCSFLNDGARDTAITKEIASKKWQVVVLQGAMLSSSHKYKHPQDGAIALAKAAKASGARTLFFAEWPRQGWDEAGYIMGIYGAIAKATGAEVVLIPGAFRDAIKAGEKGFWGGDGNHASLKGSYLAACTLHYWIARPGDQNPTFAPKGLDATAAARMRGYARKQFDRVFGPK